MSDVKRWILKNGNEHNGYVLAADYDQLLYARDGLEKERDQLRAERDSLFAERRQLESELRHRQKLIDDAWHAWDVALKGCEAMRAERDSHQRLCIAEMEKNAQLRAELEAIRGQRNVPLHAAINHACGELPDGWSIEVVAERGGAWVALYNAEMEDVEFPTDNERLDYTVKDAVEFALLSTKNAEEGE